MNITWYNTLNPAEEGTSTINLPVSIGRHHENDIVLPEAATGVAEQHAILVESDKKIVLVDVRQKRDMGLGRRGIDIVPGKPFHVGFYRLTVNRLGFNREEN